MIAVVLGEEQGQPSVAQATPPAFPTGRGWRYALPTPPIGRSRQALLEAFVIYTFSGERKIDVSSTLFGGQYSSDEIVNFLRKSELIRNVFVSVEKSWVGA